LIGASLDDNIVSFGRVQIVASIDLGIPWPGWNVRSKGAETGGNEMHLKAAVLTVVCCAFLLGFVCTGPAWAQVPHKINYQVRVTDSVTGDPLPGSHHLSLRIYDSATEGSLLWSETKTETADSSGVISTILGSGTAINISFDVPCWLEVEIDDEILSPRREMVSVPYSFHAVNSDSLGGTPSEDYVRYGEAGSITGGMITDGEITDADIAADAAIDPAKIDGTAWTSEDDGDGSGLDADMVDGYHANEFADSGHHHDERYYKEDELNTTGTINEASNPLEWTRLKNVPVGFADGTDDIGGVGDGHSLDAADGYPEDALYVDDDGDVAIGNTMPYAKFEVWGHTDDKAQIRSIHTSGATAVFGGETSVGCVGTHSDHPFCLKTHYIERMRIDTNGNVGIGTDAPERLLHLYAGSAGAITAHSAAKLVIEDNNSALMGFLSPSSTTQGMHFGDQNDESAGWIFYDHPSDKMRFGTASGDQVSILSNGNVGIGADTPGEKLEVNGNVRIEPPGGPGEYPIQIASTNYGYINYTHPLSDPLGLRLQNSNRTWYLIHSPWGDDKFAIYDQTSTSMPIVIDGATDRVGIGTYEPDLDLHVDGRMLVNDTTAYWTTISQNAHTDGTGLVAVGDGTLGYYTPSGSGIAATGQNIGIYARANDSGNDGQAAVSCVLGTGATAKVCYRTTGGTQYKIQGTGGVSTIMSTSGGKKSLMCPESPEAWVEDFGSGEIVGGRCHVDLDPLFLDCVTVNEEHPLKVFVQLTSPLAQQYYVEKGKTGFDVVVVADDAQSAGAAFDYKVVAKWKGYEHIRFEPVEESPAAVQMTKAESGRVSQKHEGLPYLPAGE
jgi:hypothetical protein